MLHRVMPTLLHDIDYVLKKLHWMHQQDVWPNGLRYLWTDAFGLTLLISLYRDLNEQKYIDDAEKLVREVDRVLGRPRGIRIGEAPDRDGQYFHYLAMWLYALNCLSEHIPQYRSRAIALARDIHRAFVHPRRGVIWKMKEDLTGPYPGFGYGALDAFNGYVVYRLLGEQALASEIVEMQELIERDYQRLQIDQDLGLGMMLWLSHFFPQENWARIQENRALAMLGHMWVDPPGYFCRAAHLQHIMFAFTNYGVSLGLQSVRRSPDRVARLNQYFDHYHSGDHYDSDAITHVMACTSHYPGAFLRAT
jgi:hypothetical protein